MPHLSRRTRAVGLIAVATALGVGYAAHFFADMRPQMVSYVCLAGLLLLLERDRMVRGSRARWLLPPLMLLWVNFHAAFMAGVSVLLATMAGEVIDIIKDIWARGTTVLFATHQARLAAALHQRTLHLLSGRLVKDEG